jgi:hypothetical protein
MLEGSRQAVFILPIFGTMRKQAVVCVGSLRLSRNRFNRSHEASSGLIPSSPYWGVGCAFFAIHSFDYLLNADEH